MDYGKRAHYDQALALIAENIWKVDVHRGLLFGRGRSTKTDAWRPIGVKRDGYLRARMGYQGPAVSIHRVIWESAYGVSDLALTINHINGDGFDNRIENLELVANAANAIHAHRELGRGNGSRNKGADNPQAKLDEDKVRQIRQRLLAGAKGIDIAREFGVGGMTISNIKHRKIWAWVE